MDGEIKIEGARENNLKNINVSIPWHKFTVVTGLSGSGKSSLALDTLYAEGLRRYIECLSTYARQFLERVDRPDMDDISGLPPAVAIESRNTVRNSRSTVGTTTEVYDYMRLLFAKIGRIFCPECGREVRHRSPGDIAEELLRGHGGERVLITFPPGNLNLTPAELLSNGFTRIIKDGEVAEVEGLPKIPAGAEIVLDRLLLDKKSRPRLVGSLELAFEESRRVNVRIVDGDVLKFSADLECPEGHMRFNEPTPLLFSFNSPQGACPECKGFGNILGLDPDLVVPNPDKSLSQGAIEPLTKPSLKPQMRKLLHFAEERGIYTDKPYASLPAKEKELIFEGGAGFPGVRGYFRRLEE
ncbi:MAG TPA: excinuclease ABC subunit A, partial [Thermodesulfobacteriota bacterium]|nr:excinuclease ABC subunit A [Thermodesulfobacteriota bacterium]